MNEGLPNSGRPQGPPGLPPGAQRIDTQHLLEKEMRESKFRPIALPLTVYDAMLLVNALAVLEGAMEAQRSVSVRLDCIQLQTFLLKHVDFTPLVRKQMQNNRKFLELPPLP